MTSGQPDPTRRFSDRVDDYVRYRPHYPAGVLDVLRTGFGLRPQAVIADVGSGTGISAELFLANGNRVFAVEPNPAMRAAAERLLGSRPGFASVDGTAEATTLEPGSVDAIVAAQAFHWFDPGRARAEFRRILKPGGWVALIWNTRVKDTAFARAYEALLSKYGTDYAGVTHERLGPAALAGFFSARFLQTELPNAQQLDRDALRGRLLSSSYVPATGQPGHDAMLAELDAIFREHHRDGCVRFDYVTQMYVGSIESAN